MDKLEIKQGSFIQQTQYFILVEIDLSVVTARLGIWLFHLSRRRRTTVIQDLLVRCQFSLVTDNRTNVNVEARVLQTFKKYSIFDWYRIYTIHWISKRKGTLVQVVYNCWKQKEKYRALKNISFFYCTVLFICKIKIVYFVHY